MSFFIHNITVFHFDDEEKAKKIFFNGGNLPKVYFRHNEKVNVIDKRNRKCVYRNNNNTNR